MKQLSLNTPDDLIIKSTIDSPTAEEHYSIRSTKNESIERPSHLSAMDQLRSQQHGPSELAALKEQCIAKAWTMKQFEEEVWKSYRKLKSHA